MFERHEAVSWRVAGLGSENAGVAVLPVEHLVIVRQLAIHLPPYTIADSFNCK